MNPAKPTRDQGENRFPGLRHAYLDLSDRGSIRLFQGDNKGGLADHDKALQYDPGDSYSWNNRAHAKMRLGDKMGAIADFRKALEIDPSLRTAQEGLQELRAAR